MPPKKGEGAPAGDIDPDDYVSINRTTHTDPANKFVLDPTGRRRLSDETTRMVREEGRDPKARVTHEELRAIAKDLGRDPDDFLSHVHKNIETGRMSGAEVLATRNILKQNIEAEEKLAKMLDSGTLGRDEAEKLSQTYELLQSQNRAMLSRLTDERSQAGRNLNSLKILAEQTHDPVTWLMRAQRMAGGPLDDLTRARISELVKGGDMNAAAREVAKLHETTGIEKAMAAWKAGLLTGPPTHFLNLIGTTTNLLARGASDYPAAAYDRVFSAIFNTARTKSAPGGRQLAMVARRGAKRGAEEAREAWKGVQASDGKYDYKRVNYKNPLLDLAVNSVFNSLTAMDRFLRGFMLEASLTEQLNLVAKAEGLKGKAARARVKELLESEDISDAVALNALEAAMGATFTNKGILGGAVGSAKQSLKQQGKIGELLWAGSEAVMPFTSTPTNVATSLIKATPLGAAAETKKLVRAMFNDLPKEQRKAMEALGFSSVGLAPIAIGAYLQTKGKITLGYDPEQRARREITGEQPNSVKIGDRWVNLGRLQPIGGLMLLGAYATDKFTDPELTTTEKVAGTAMGTARSFTEQTFLAGLKSALDALGEGPQASSAAGSWARNFARSWVPAIVGRAAKQLDKTPRQVDTMADAFQSVIPGQSKKLPERLTQLGDPQRLEPVGGPFLDPFGSAKSRTKGDPVAAELDRVKANLSSRGRRTEDGKRESSREYRNRISIEGRMMRNAIQALISSEEYRAIPQLVEERGYGPEVAVQVQRQMIEEVPREVRGKLSRGYRGNPGLADIFQDRGIEGLQQRTAN